MLRLTEVVGRDAAGQGADAPAPALTLTLTFEDRRRSRLLVHLGDGSEAALMLPRGTVLRDGDYLRGETGVPVVTVRAAAETLSVARTADAHLLSRAAYHLGNRHVPLQIIPGALSYQHDHVLDDLARELGLTVVTEQAPFEPEAGGYRNQGSRTHGHDQGHDHNHAHGHDHHHPHDHDH